MITKINKLLLFFFIIFFSQHNCYADEWKEFKRVHFIIYYKNAPLYFVKDVEKNAEEYYQSIARDMGLISFRNWSQNNPAHIYIYDDAEDFKNTGRMAKWAQGNASVIEKKISTYPSAHGFFDSTLPHEIGHIIFRSFAGYDVDVPLWFEEGFAMYQEKGKRYGADKEVRKAISEGTFMTIKELNNFIPRKNTDINYIYVFYAESASIVNFLINEYGMQKFSQLCRQIKSKKSFDRAFEAVYIQMKNMDRLNEKWINYLENK